MNTLGPRMGPSSKLDLPVNGELQGSSPPTFGSPKLPIENKKEFSKFLGDKKRPTETRAEETRPRKTETQEPVKNRRKSAERETAMLNFMDSMESEFGVTPVRMLEALAVLDHEDLARTPEESASAVIDNLELAPEDEPEAMQLYMSFIGQWQNLQGAKPENIQPTAEDPRFFAGAGLNKSMLNSEAIAKPSTAGLNQTQLAAQANAAANPAQSVLSPREKLNASLDKMNDKFFLKTNAEALMLPEMDSSLTEIPTELVTDFSMRDEASILSDNELGFRLPSELGPPQAGPQQAAPPLAAPPNTGAAGLVLMQAQQQAPEALAKADGSVEGKKDIDALLREIAGLPAQQPALTKSDLASTAKTETSFFPIGAAGIMTPGIGGDSGSSDGDLADDGGSDQSGQDAGLDQSQTQMGHHLNSDFTQVMKTGENRAQTGAAMAGGAGMFAAPNDADVKQDIQTLKDKAQLMIKDGGGEAKIRLNAEGLGEIHLKVAVQNGKVSVDIGTDNKEAKQLIESSISDLRAGLSQHKLSVDNVKVDVGQGNTDSQQQQQKGLNFGQDMNRDQARQMMSNFRDEMASRRDPFFEMSGIKAYSRKRTDLDPIAPATNTVGQRRVEGRGDRMNLIA